MKTSDNEYIDGVLLIFSIKNKIINNDETIINDVIANQSLLKDNYETLRAMFLKLQESLPKENYPLLKDVMKNIQIPDIEIIFDRFVLKEHKENKEYDQLKIKINEIIDKTYDNAELAEEDSFVRWIVHQVINLEDTELEIKLINHLESLNNQI